MPDPLTITAILTGLKTAAEIAKTLSQSDANLERAEMKLKMAELIETLAAVKMAAVELKENLVEKDQEIARLSEAMALRADIIKSGDAYFRKDESGNPAGDAFCLHCWDSTKALYYLTRSQVTRGPSTMLCAVCKNHYNWADIGWPRS